MVGTCFNGLDVLYHHAKFGEDRTNHARCSCKNMVFVTIFLSLQGRSALRERGT